MFRLVITEARHLIGQRSTIERLAGELLGRMPTPDACSRCQISDRSTRLPSWPRRVTCAGSGHHRQFLKFCGLDLATHQSGQCRGKTKLSKRGNARLRRTLWMAAQVAIRQRENSFRVKFERYVAKDREDPDLRRKAFTAITAKMARVVQAIIKSGVDYQPFVERPVPGGRTPHYRSRKGASATL